MDCDVSPVNARKRPCFGKSQLLDQSPLDACDTLPLEPQNPCLSDNKARIDSASACATEIQVARVNHDRGTREIGATASLESANRALAAELRTCRAELQQAMRRYETAKKGRVLDAEMSKVASEAAQRCNALALQQSALERNAEKEELESEIAAARAALEEEKEARELEVAALRAALQAEKEGRARDAVMATAALEVEIKRAIQATTATAARKAETEEGACNSGMATAALPAGKQERARDAVMARAPPEVEIEQAFQVTMARAAEGADKIRQAFEEATTAETALVAKGDACAAQDTLMCELLQISEQCARAARAHHQNLVVPIPMKEHSCHVGKSRGRSQCEGLNSSLNQGQSSPRQHVADTDLCRADDPIGAFLCFWSSMLPTA